MAMTLSQAHQQLTTHVNQLHRIARDLAETDGEAANAAQLEAATRPVDAVLEDWYNELNPPPETPPQAVPATARPAASAPVKSGPGPGH